MENTVSGIDIGKAIIKKQDDGHLYIWVRDGEELDVEDIKAMMEAKTQLCGDEPHTTIFIMGNYSSISNEARIFASSKEVYKGTIAKSIVANSLSTKLVGNFFIRFNNPPAPTKLFENEKEAVKWLNQIRE